MKIIEINGSSYGSTGNIIKGIASVAKSRGHEIIFCYPGIRENIKHGQANDYLIGGRISRNIHIRLSRITGLHGCFSVFSTLKLISKIKKESADVIHLHNLHGWYINIPLLFCYLKKSNKPVVWTLHDCWSFTGQCTHFLIENCEKWKGGCYSCPQIAVYPATKVDLSRSMWKLKRKWFTGINNMTIVTPSQWLADLVRQSFLKDYPVNVIHNGIDLSVFCQTCGNFRLQHDIKDDEFMILGVAFGWGTRKGLDVFIELAKTLNNDYRIVLVGTNEEIDSLLPKNIISIHRTQNQHDLAEIYSAADVFLNPTREDNFPTVNMEALACGTPVITFRTGGSPEVISEGTGCVIDVDDIRTLKKTIINVCTNKVFSEYSCVERAKAFDRDISYSEYIDVFEGLLLNGK